MGALRHLIRRHPGRAWALVALALLMKLVVPAGFMPTASAAGFAIEICSGSALSPALSATGPAAQALAAMAHKPGGEHAPARPDAPCPYAALTLPGVGGVDALQLALALGVILAVGLRPVAGPAARRLAYLRPFLRGPPALG